MKKKFYQVVEYSRFVSDVDEKKFMQIDSFDCDVEGKIVTFQRSAFHAPEAVLIGSLALTPEDAIELKKAQLVLDVKAAQLRVAEAKAEAKRFEEMLKRYKENPDKLGDSPGRR